VADGVGAAAVGRDGAAAAARSAAVAAGDAGETDDDAWVGRDGAAVGDAVAEDPATGAPGSLPGPYM
jgi:hypothetical protein